VPIVNLLQHVRHGRPGDRRYPFLRHRAIRICVGEEVRASVAATGQVNGPLFAILNGLNLEERHWGLRGKVAPEIDILIAAIKQPEIGRQLAARLRPEGRRLELLDAPLLRADYLDRVVRAKVTVFLPNPAEGLYLPPLEGMALGTLVVCARVPGTEYCQDGYNCFYPDYTLEALQAAAEAAVALDDAQRARLLAQANEAVARHDLQKERKAFLDILRNVDQLW
jgi:glycosyltransferase involved in cell wall biosynthesis